MSQQQDTVSDQPYTDGSAHESEELETLRATVARLKRKVSDQKERIEALARGREEGMNAVGELRAELALLQSELTLVQDERDRLRQELTALEGMQTETIADVDDRSDSRFDDLPLISELMESLGGDSTDVTGGSHATASVERDSAVETGEYQEMISPDLLLLGSKPGVAAAPDERYLLLLTSGPNIRCPLDQDLVTIGRSESADVAVNGDFISRIHARILRIGMDTVVEDAGSKNGTWINGEQVSRHVLTHGDLLRVGSAHFRFVDTARANSDPE